MSASRLPLTENAGRTAVVSVCLDLQTYTSVTQLLASQADIGLTKNINQYIGAEREISRALEAGATRVCIVDLDVHRIEAHKLIERLQVAHPDIFVIGVSASSEAEYLISAMRNGCSDFLLKPIQTDALHAALLRVEAKQRERRLKKKRGKIISLIGAKGGSGVTTLALHLSLDLACDSGKKCLLVDLHPALGDSSFYLGIGRHKYSVYELAGSIERLDEDLIEGFVQHHDSGLDLLDSPESVDFSAYAAPAALEQTISFLAEAYDYIVIDCPPGLSEAALSIFSQSDQIAIVLTAEVAAVRNAVRYTEYLSKIGVNPAAFFLVLNRYSKKEQLGEDRLEKTLQSPIALRIPNCYPDIIRSINAGTPMQVGRKSEFGTAIASWSRELIAEPPSHDLPGRNPSGNLINFFKH